MADPLRLNKYKGWSEQVYGELSSGMISEIVYKVPILKTHRFIDLGSGVGQVVLQVSGESGCSDSLGIEKQEIPAEYAEIMGECFNKMMAWFGMSYGSYSIVQGDFLDQQYLQVLQSVASPAPLF